MLDSILELITTIAWMVFTIFVVIFFVRAVRKHGLVRAGLQLLSFRVTVPLLLVIILTLVSASIVFVEPYEVAVVVSVPSPGGIRPQPLRAGLHWLLPFLEYEVRYPISWQTYTMSAAPMEGNQLGDDSIRARTNDGQEVRVDCSVIFRIDPEQAVTLHIDWQQRYTEDFVRPVIRGFVRTQVSQFNVREVNSQKRKDLESALNRLLGEEFGNKGLMLDQFLLRDITFTPEYAASIEDKQIALEGEQQSEHEAQQVVNLAQGHAKAIQLQAEAEANALRIKAEGQSAALKMLGEALKQNPDLITYQYVEKIAPNIQVMLVPNNAPLILPLPTLAPPPPVTKTMDVTATVATMLTPTPVLTEMDGR